MPTDTWIQTLLQRLGGEGWETAAVFLVLGFVIGSIICAVGAAHDIRRARAKRQRQLERSVIRARGGRHGNL